MSACNSKSRSCGRRSAPSRSTAARSARSGSARSARTNVLPDRPEIRGMIARVPHLVSGGGDPVKIHDLKPAPGSRRPKRRVGRGIGGKGGKTAGRGSKGQGARGTVPARFEGGQTPLHRRTPKAKGFNNPFRVEYHVVNLTTLDGVRRRRRGHARHAARARPRRQAGPGQGARPGRAHQAAHRPGARLLGGGGPGDRGRGRHRRDAAAAVGRPASAGPRERAHQPLGTLPVPVSTGGRRAPYARAFALAEHVPGPRPAEQDPLHDLHHLHLPARVAHPGAVRRLQARSRS